MAGFNKIEQDLADLYFEQDLPRLSAVIFDFGMIKYYLKINSRVLIAIIQFKIVRNVINKIGGRTSNALIGIKNSGVLNQFYSDLKEL
jgi:hypothetical protein